MLKNSKPQNWSEFHKNQKDVFNDIRDHICINEQNCLCGYTELPIEDITECHIDHYKKKNIFHTLEFDWGNFIVSCNDDNYGARYKDQKHCKCKDDYNNILNPVTDKCEDFFQYDSFGNIYPNRSIDKLLQQKAQNTIDVFNLTHKSLVNCRAAIMLAINSYKDQMTIQDIQSALSNSGFRSFVDYQLANL